jgi:hypothetical protein
MTKPQEKMRDLLRDVLEDEDYLKRLKDRLKFGALPAALEVRLWEYVYGKPPDKIEIKDDRSKLDKMTTEELVNHLEELKELATILVKEENGGQEG